MVSTKFHAAEIIINLWRIKTNFNYNKSCFQEATWKKLVVWIVYSSYHYLMMWHVCCEVKKYTIFISGRGVVQWCIDWIWKERKWFIYSQLSQHCSRDNNLKVNKTSFTFNFVIWQFNDDSEVFMLARSWIIENLLLLDSYWYSERGIETLIQSSYLERNLTEQLNIVLCSSRHNLI